jgi:MFS family permease
VRLAAIYDLLLTWRRLLHRGAYRAVAAERILPVVHHTHVAGAGGSIFYDIYMVAYIGATLQHSGFLSLHQFWGTISFGMGSDRMGRRGSFVAMLQIYSAFTLAGAFAPSAHG